MSVQMPKVTVWGYEVLFKVSMLVLF